MQMLVPWGAPLTLEVATRASNDSCSSSAFWDSFCGVSSASPSAGAPPLALAPVPLSSGAAPPAFAGMHRYHAPPPPNPPCAPSQELAPTPSPRQVRLHQRRRGHSGGGMEGGAWAFAR
eukprot:9485481-Pyramimonas_sp.AAC.1